MDAQRMADVTLEVLEEAYDEGRLREWVDDAVEIDPFIRYGYYEDCCITITYGGPTVCLNTAKSCIEVSWGDDKGRASVPHEIRDAIDEIVETIT